MKEQKVDGVDQLLRPRGPRKFCADVDALKTEEWKRRRLLRLEQVRQQSKDIANNIRRKVFQEKNNLVKNLQKRNEIAAVQWKEEKLNALQNELTETLYRVGSAHKEAEHQEANKQYKTDHVEAADRRGREAILRLRSEEHTRKQADEARKNQRIQVRSIEEARSAVLVSLPVPKSTVPTGNVVRRPKPNVQREKSFESVSKVWPSKSWSASVPLGVTPPEIDDRPRMSNSPKSDTTSERKDNAPICVCSNEGNETVSVLSSGRQRTSSINAPTEASSNGNIASGSGKKSVPDKINRGQNEVEFYDCASGSYKQNVKPSVVCLNVPPGPVDGLEAAEACAANLILKKEISQTMALKRIERGKEAMKRVQTRREHQELLTDLANLVRQQAALSSLVPSVNSPKHQRKRYDTAVDGREGPTCDNIQKVNLGPEDSQELLEETEGTVRLKTSAHADRTMINVCSEGEADEHLGERRLTEDGAIGRSVAVPENKLNTSKQEQKIGVTKSGEAKEVLPGRETTREEKDSFLSVDVTGMSTSVDEEVPNVNLALWTSRSSGHSSRIDITLTPSDRVHERDFSTETDSVDKTLTPSKNLGERMFTTSTTSTTSEHAMSDEIKTAPVEVSNLRGSDKSQLERVPKKVRSHKHLRLGDNSLQRSTLEKKISIKKAPKVFDVQSEAGSTSPREVKSPLKKESSASSGSTSYMSLPNKLLSAITDDLRSLLSLTRAQGGASHTNPLLSHYINRLLDMSRQSIERLNVVTSEVCTPPSALFHSGFNDSSTRRSTSRSLLSSVDEPDRLSNVVSLHSDTTDISSLGDSSSLVSVMQQCYNRITALSQRIEQIRQEKIVSTPVVPKSPSLHLDSTAYLSPPSTFAVSSKIAPGITDLTGNNYPMDDTYSAAITRLVAEIRQQLVRHSEDPLQTCLQPSHSSAENLKSVSFHELSTILEQDQSSVEWPSVVISSETGASSEEVEKEFSRMGLGWAGTTLRKTKEACTLDSNSSSDFLEFSALSLFGSHSHSTPIKAVEDFNHLNP